MAGANQNLNEIGTIDYIEYWFLNENWELTEEEREKKENEFPARFFDTHVAALWTFLSLMDIINIAKAYKSAAYLAYFHNEKGFKDFCNMAWIERKMDLTKFPILTEEILSRLFVMFGDLDEVIFPANVPDTILSRLPYAHIFTFNLIFDLPYRTPKTPMRGHSKITINGNFCMSMDDSMTKILFTFPHIYDLILHNVYLTRTSIAAMGITEIKNISFTQSAIYPHQDLAFVNALLNSRTKLESISFDSNSNYTWESTIQVLNSKIKKFAKLRNYRLTMKLKWRNAMSLSSLAESRTLKHVHIITNGIETPEQIEIKNKIERSFRGRNITLTIERRTLEQTPIELDD